MTWRVIRTGLVSPAIAHLVARVVAPAFIYALLSSSSNAQPTSAPVASVAAVSGAASQRDALPYQIERFNLPGPMAGVAARIDLGDPRIAAKVVLADDRDPDGSGPCVGQLESPSVVARKHDFVITLNASFFDAPTTRDLMGKKVRYYTGNCTWPVGWHVSAGKIVAKPADSKMRAVLLIADDGQASVRDDVNEIPAGTRYAVSGNALVLKKGKPTSADENGTRHPRSVAGVSADGRTLWLVAVDGRQESSRGASMSELGDLMAKLGAYDAVNLDGGGSTVLVVKDLRTGTYGVANQPSETSTEGFQVRMERPVADVVGISFTAPADTKPKK